MRRRLCTIETPSGRTESRYIATARCESSNGKEGRHDSLVDDPKVVFFYRADCELCKRRISYTYNRVKVKGARTISVASTRVPTIFRRTLVFFSMTCAHVGGGERKQGEGTNLVLGCEAGWIRIGVELQLRVDQLAARRVYVNGELARRGRQTPRRGLTWCDTNTVRGPTSAKKPI